MKVILLQDVAKLGRRFDIVEVSSGHALNKLIPQGLVQEATTQNVKNIEARKEKANADRSATGEAFTASLKKAESQKVEIEAGANEQGHLFEALKSAKIAEALAAQGFAFTEAQIHVHAPIKKVGEHTLMLKEGDVEGEVTITVVAKQ